jgi:2-polyprenyl-3-methyl-5-hydroxy-6-metoxy-1,4-benzoquinol methylase
MTQRPHATNRRVATFVAMAALSLLCFFGNGGAKVESRGPTSDAVLLSKLPVQSDAMRSAPVTTLFPIPVASPSSLPPSPTQLGAGCPVHLGTGYPAGAVFSTQLFSAALPPIQGAMDKRLSERHCPTKASLLYLDPALDNDTNIDQRASHITFKYQYYVTRCNRTNGIMWKHMTLPVMHAVTQRVVTLICKLMRWQCEGGHGAAAPSTAENSPALPASDVGRPTSIRVLDWASGCGAGTVILRDTISSQFPARSHSGDALEVPTVDVIGIDLMEPAVAFAREHLRNTNASKGGHISYCHADGTKLSWIPDGAFDVITSFGGLLHLPSAVMCSTVQQLLGKLRPGGVMWAGYLDTFAITDALAKCSGVLAKCPGSAAVRQRQDATEEMTAQNSPAGPLSVVHTTILRENEWFKNIGMPRVYRRKKPYSVVWHRLQ